MHLQYSPLNVLSVVNLSKLVTNYVASNKSFQIQDSCLLEPLITKIVYITFIAILKQLLLLQTCKRNLIWL